MEAGMALIEGVEIPDGYIPGQDRVRGHQPDERMTHLYHGDFNDPGLPMCPKGWNGYEGREYSIWRNRIGPKGVCRTCLNRARKGLPGVKGGEK
jgi:hypothetical protein